MRLWVSNIIFSIVYLFFAFLFIVLSGKFSQYILPVLSIPLLGLSLWLPYYIAKWLSPRPFARARSEPDSAQVSAPRQGFVETNAQPSQRQK